MKSKLLIIFVSFLVVKVSFAQDYHWPLDTDLTDIVGAKNGTKTIVGVSFVNDAVRGQVLSLDGTGYVTLPVQLFKDVSEATITCWFNYAGISVWERVYSFGYSNATETVNPTLVQTIYLVPRDGGGKLHVTYQATGPWYDFTNTTSADSVSPNTWYFSAFVREGDSIKFYLNDHIVPGFKSKVVENPSLLNDSMNYIGKSHWIDNNLTGMVDDLRIYKKALTHSEILALYQPTGIEDSKQDIPLIYSSNGMLYVKMNNIEISSISVYNILGVEVYRSSGINDVNRIDLKQHGIYIVQVKAGQQLFIRKVYVGN